MASKDGSSAQTAPSNLEQFSPASTIDEKSLESQQPRPKERQVKNKLHRMMSLPLENVQDLVLGASDGFTVPFALAAGLTAFGSPKAVWIAALAELIAGSISMGVGGYLSSRSAGDNYKAKRRDCVKLLIENPEKAREIIIEYFETYHVPEEVRMHICDTLMGTPEDAIQFLIRNHFGAAEPTRWRGLICALTMGFSYFLGGFLPLIPYWCFPHVLDALWTSISMMVVILPVFGYCRTCTLIGWRGKENIQAGLWGALLMFVMGGTAAAAAAGVVRGINSHANIRCL